LEVFDPGRRAADDVVFAAVLTDGVFDGDTVDPALLEADVLVFPGPLEATVGAGVLDAVVLDAGVTDGLAGAAFEDDALCVDLWCATGFEEDEPAFAAVVFDGASCATRLPAAHSATAIARVEMRKRTV
jgi:hypothetical protein